MKILEYINSLLPTTERSTVLAQLRVQLLDLDEIIIPSYRASLDVFGPGYKFKSPAMRNVEAGFSRYRMSARRVNFIQDTLNALVNTASLLPGLVSEVEKAKGDTIVRDGIDLRLATVLQIASYDQFLNNYALKLLQWAYAAESNAHVPSNSPDCFSRAEKKWVTDNLQTFITVVDFFSHNPAEMIQKLNGVPKVDAINLDYEAATAVDAAKIDPLKLGFLPLASIISEPAYRLGKLWAEYSVKKHNERKDLKTALELRLLDMKMAMEGNADAALGKRIDYQEKRIQNLTYEINNYEV